MAKKRESSSKKEPNFVHKILFRSLGETTSAMRGKTIFHGLKNNRPAKSEQKNLIVNFLLALVILLSTVSLFGFYLMWFTEYYNNIFHSKVILRNNSDASKTWMNPPAAYDTLLRVHVFNYTNIDAFLSGKDKKIKVEDIGPLTYQEHTTKVNVQFNNNYTVTYKDHRNYTFLKEKSAVGEYEKILVPNVPLLTAEHKIENMYFLKKIAAIPLIRALDEKPFKTISIHDYLWGYKDKIMSMDFGTGSTRFGLLMNRNGTSIDTLQLHTGEDDMRKHSIVSQFNGESHLRFWSNEKCNRIDGSEATMFPLHLLSNKDTIQVFLQVLCRKISLEFETEVQIFKRISAYRYKTPKNAFGSPERNPENKCFCERTLKCLPSGIINATNCYNGAPIYPSFPHFFAGDPILYEDFEGIHPEASKHQTFADIHPRFAFPITGASRIQINIELTKSSLLKYKLQRLKDGLVLPLIWIEITSGDFTDDIIDKLYATTFGLNAVKMSLKYGTVLTFLISFGSFIAAITCISRF